MNFIQRASLAAITFALLVVFGLACGGGDRGAAGPRHDLAGITFHASPDWTDQGATGMRAANYTYGPVEGDSDAAEITVFFFGGGQGGDIDSNMRRWTGQMQAPDGGSAESLAKVSTLTSDADLFEHFIEVSGTFMKSTGRGGPMAPGPKTPMEGWRLVGAIIEAPQGNVFFKMVGPEATVRATEDAFRQMVVEAKRG